MRMGSTGGGEKRRSLSVGKQNDVLRCLEKCKNKHTTVDEAIDYLRSKFPRYRRSKVQNLTALVRQTLEQRSKATPPPSRTSNRLHFDDGDNQTPARKKPKMSVDAGIKNERMTDFGKQEASSRSSSEEEDNDEEEGAVSISEDSDYLEKVVPEFDLMQQMLRDNYSSVKISSNLEEEMENGGKPNNKMIAPKASTIKGGGGEDNGGEKGKGSSSGSFEPKGKEAGPRFRDLGGMDAILEELMMEVIVPFYHPQLPLWLGVRPIAGILLHGPPGCGKTKLAHAIANETGFPFYKISATEVVSGVSGASEENIRELFSKAYRTAPSIVFIDEVDAIASKRENLQREMERRIVTQLMTCMDESQGLLLSNSESSDGRTGYVLVIGATNRPDAVDPALRRPGRFDREFFVGIPDENARAKILSVLTRNLRLEGSFDLSKLARSTPGFVGADLADLVKKAGNLAMNRILDKRKSVLVRESVLEEQSQEWWRHPWLPEEMEKLSITMANFEEATQLVQPSLRREGFSTIPNVKWEDIGGLDSLREEFDRYIVKRIKYPENYEGVDLDTGFLLYGPPGCGKSVIAKAVANEAGANFIHIKGPELLSKYVGESELSVRTIFSRARMCSPCILFFDEVDALTTERGREGGWVVERLLNQLLIELDGADQRRGVFVIGATNRPEVMDRAVLRPGRFGKLLYVPLPNAEERGLILKALARKKPIDDDADLIAIGQKAACENLSGADLAALMNEAAMIAQEDKLTSTQNNSGTTPTPTPTPTPWTIKMIHFERALQKISPSVSDKQKQYYQTLSARFKAA